VKIFSVVPLNIPERILAALFGAFYFVALFLWVWVVITTPMDEMLQKFNRSEIPSILIGITMGFMVLVASFSVLMIWFPQFRIAFLASVLISTAWFCIVESVIKLHVGLPFSMAKDVLSSILIAVFLLGGFSWRVFKLQKGCNSLALFI